MTTAVATGYTGANLFNDSVALGIAYSKTKSSDPEEVKQAWKDFAVNAEKVAAGMMELCQAPSWASGSVGLAGNAAQIIPAAKRIYEKINSDNGISNVSVADVLAVTGGLSDMTGNSAFQRGAVVPAAILKGTGLLAGVAQGKTGTEPDFPGAMNKEQQYAKAGANQTWWRAASHYPARQ